MNRKKEDELDSTQFELNMLNRTDTRNKLIKVIYFQINYFQAESEARKKKKIKIFKKKYYFSGLLLLFCRFLVMYRMRQ